VSAVPTQAPYGTILFVLRNGAVGNLNGVKPNEMVVKCSEV